MPFKKGLLLVFCSIALFAYLRPMASFADVTADDVANRRADLQATLQTIESQIAAQQQLLQEKQNERQSVERDMDILDAEIKTAQLSIQARNIAVQNIADDINGKVSAIGSLNSKLEREKESLAQLLRKTAESDDISMVELILSNEAISDFFDELDSYDSIKVALRNSFSEIDNTKNNTEAAKETLQTKKDDQTELLNLQLLQQQKIKDQEAEKQKIVDETKGQEAVYQKIITASEKTAAEIRTELFELRDTAAIPFGQAVEYADAASKATGVRPALILGVLKQESSLGEFLGTGSWKVDMHPTRDRPLYLAITSTLGLDPDRMPVSKKGGASTYGGAMGPAQFIPSTWACYGGFINTRTGDCANSAHKITMTDFWSGPWTYVASKDRLRTLSHGSTPSNPWDPKDAIMAAAVLMADNGADAGTRSSERLAALRYFAGWTNASNPNYAFYGDGVMDNADDFQQQIDILSKS
jgi:peptidoglycan hydrolase CwlO-like protein